MKTEQEKIEEMAKQMCGDKDTFAKDLCSCCIAWDDCLEEAGNLYKAGYRKATEVIDEFVERLKNQFDSNGNLNTAMFGRTTSEIKMLIDLSSKDFINELAAEMRQEVEK